jgi:hypothetical protein
VDSSSGLALEVTHVPRVSMYSTCEHQQKVYFCTGGRGSCQKNCTNLLSLLIVMIGGFMQKHVQTSGKCSNSVEKQGK